MTDLYPNKNGEYIALFMLGKFKNKKMIDKIAKQLNLPIKKWEFKENKDIRLFAPKEKIFCKYYRYKILSKILLCKKRKHYKNKRIKYKSYVRRIRKLVR